MQWLKPIGYFSVMSIGAKLGGAAGALAPSLFCPPRRFLLYISISKVPTFFGVKSPKIPVLHQHYLPHFGAYGHEVFSEQFHFEESTFSKWYFFGIFYSTVILHSIRLSNLFLSKWLYTFWRRMDKKVFIFLSWFFCTSFSHQAVLLMQDSFKKAFFNLAIYYKSTLLFSLKTHFKWPQYVRSGT